MGEKTGIAWTDSTWNPVRGCTKVSAGCKNCYAETFAERWRGVKGHPFEQGFDVRLVPEALELPLRWRKPRRIFVNSMSDLFHSDVPTSFIDRIFGVMAACRHHTFQVLTKRPARMLAYLTNSRRAELVSDHIDPEWRDGRRGEPICSFPLPNVWLGVSVEDQASANERIPHLLATPAAHRFLSCEPLLGPVDILDFLMKRDLPKIGPGPLDYRNIPAIGWVIVGGESGPKARPCDVDWIRSLLAQCEAMGTPAFTKQLGARPVDSDRRCGTFAEHDRRSIAAAAHLGCADNPPNLVMLHDRAGRDPAEWPEDLRVQQYPEITT